jgi:dipeptidyl aminopeptidase/acylaminoacyl peptidase
MKMLASVVGCFLLSYGASYSCLSSPDPAETHGPRVTLSDLANLVGLSAPTISPDGQRVVVVVSQPNFADNRAERSLVLVDVGTGTERVLTSALANPAAPQWSPRGNRLAWLDSVDGGPPQVYVLSMSEAGAQPVVLTSASLGVDNNFVGVPSFEWSPDGKFIAFITADPRPEPQGEERYNKSFEVVDNDYLATEAPHSFHVWVVSASGGTPKRLNSGDGSVVGIGWLPTGQSMVFSNQPRPHNRAGAYAYAEFMHASSNTTALKIIDLASGNEHVIAPMAHILSAPTPSPNGDLIAYRRSHGTDPWTHTANVAVIRPSGDEPRDVTIGLDRNIAAFEWLPGDRAFLVTANDGTRGALWMQPLDGAARQLDVGSVIELSDLTVSESGALAFIGVESRHPPELYVMSSINAKPRRLTRFNEHFAHANLGRAETIKWRLDGFEQTGVLIYPPDFKEGQKLPLVLDIHGGPEATASEGFDLFDQILAAQGWMIFKPNYRGSDPQGDAYQSAIIKDPGDGPGRDIMAGLAAVKSRVNVDEQRVAVSGWSYGGYLSAWLITHFQGWRAAVIGAPITEALDWYDLSCCNAWADVFGGSPWLNNNAANYWRYSPVAYASNVKTPVLLLQNLGDPEAPFSQSYHFYHALRDNGVPVQFIAYPLQGHGPETDPVNERDKFRRWIGWIDHHFGGAMPEPSNRPSGRPN